MSYKTPKFLRVLAACMCLATALVAHSGEPLSPWVAIFGKPRALIEASTPYSFTPMGVVFNSPNGAERRFRIENLPRWAVFDPVGGSLTGTPGVNDAGVYADIRISIVSGLAKASLEPFRIVVLPPLPAIPNPLARAARLSWEAPFTNLDDSPLNDLVSYVIYSAQNPLRMRPVATVPHTTTRYSWQMNNLPRGRNYFAITALNRVGIESPMSIVVAKDVP